MEINYLIELSMPEDAWNNMKAVTPDAVDMQMQQEIDSDPDCRDFISSSALLKELGL